MKTVKSATKSVILAALVAAVGVGPFSSFPISFASEARAAQYVPRTATEAVFFSHGYVEAYAEGEDVYNRGLAEVLSQGESIANLPVRISFITMARNNETVMRVFFQANSTGRYNVLVAYFSGRVAAFLALAEAYGETE